MHRYEIVMHATREDLVFTKADHLFSIANRWVKIALKIIIDFIPSQWFLCFLLCFQFNMNG